MKKLLRRVLYVSLFLVLLAGAVLLGLKFYLASDRVRRQVEARLAQVYGGPVHVDSAAVGLWSTTTLRGLQLFEGDTKAWASAAQVRRGRRA